MRVEPQRGIALPRAGRRADRSGSTLLTTGGRGFMHVIGQESNGAIGAGEVIFSVANDVNTRFMVRDDGNLYYDGTATTYDTFEDVYLVRAMDHQVGEGLVLTALDAAVPYDREDLVRAGVLTDGGFVSVTAHTRLLNGAVWQLYQRYEALRARLVELERRPPGRDPWRRAGWEAPQ